MGHTDIATLRREAIRLGTDDLSAARLLQQAGDEIERLRPVVAVLVDQMQHGCSGCEFRRKEQG